LRTILRLFRGSPDHLCVKISPNRNGHGEPPLFTTLNHFVTDLKIPMRVTFSETWYKEGVRKKRPSRATALRQKSRHSSLSTQGNPTA
jgi:hypothetical protein